MVSANVQVMSFPGAERNHVYADAVGLDARRGAFVVTDGAGSLLYSDKWAQFLAQHSVDNPLHSEDPWEVEFWLSQAQERFKTTMAQVNLVPGPQQCDKIFRLKAENGSAATWAAVYMTEVHRSFAKARLLLLGDSCIFIAKYGQRSVSAYPFHTLEALQDHPLCFSSLPRLFDRSFHRCASVEVILEPGDVALLATDGVVPWILKHPEDQRWDAIKSLAGLTPLSWPAFIGGNRSEGTMPNDDATIVVVQIEKHHRGMENLGTASYSEVWIKERREAFFQAVQAMDKEKMAIYFGDGGCFDKRDIAHGLIDNARKISTSLNAIRQTYFRYVKTLSSSQSQVDIEQAKSAIEHAWLTYEDFLSRAENSVSVQNLLTFLQRNNVLQHIQLPPLSPTVSRKAQRSGFRKWLAEMVKHLLLDEEEI